jgi:tight adherence protein B
LPEWASTSFDELATLVERLAVLLGAGVTPDSAWEHLGGRRTGDSEAWRGLEAAWDVATDAGAPLAPTLHRFAASLRALGDNERDARTAMAGPQATTRLMLALPLVGVLFGLALGFDTVGTLFTTVPGLLCLGIGLVLVLAARFWSTRMLRSARAPTAVPGLGFDLVAIAVSGGASFPRALAAVAAAQSAYRLVPDDPSEILELSSRAGVPAALLLRSAAEQARREARARGQRAAERLGVTLMLPLGLCVLPAFMVLAVAPMLLAVVSSTVIGV